MDDFERNEAERRKFLNSARLKKVDRFLTQSGMRKEQVRLDSIKNEYKQNSIFRWRKKWSVLMRSISPPWRGRREAQAELTGPGVSRRSRRSSGRG